MKLGFVTTEERGATDRFLSALAERLLAHGVRLAGVVQTNTECGGDRPCDMDLRVLPDGETIRISQSLGSRARGCRLNPEGLERAVGLVGRSLDDRPELLIINKFGKHEADGRGFRPLIGEAMLRGIPVLVGLNGLNRAHFLEFTEGAAEEIPPDAAAVGAWLKGDADDAAA